MTLNNFAESVIIAVNQAKDDLSLAEEVRTLASEFANFRDDLTMDMFGFDLGGEPSNECEGGACKL